MSLDPGMRREVLEHNLVAGGVGRLPDSEDEDKEVTALFIYYPVILGFSATVICNTCYPLR